MDAARPAGLGLPIKGAERSLSHSSHSFGPFRRRTGLIGRRFYSGVVVVQALPRRLRAGCSPVERGIGAVYERRALGSAALRTHRKRANGQPPNVGLVQVALLGPLEVRSEKGPVGLSAPKQRAVVEMLALRPGRPVTAELLIAGLWGESPPASAAKVLQTYVSRLRGAIPELCLYDLG